MLIHLPIIILTSLRPTPIADAVPKFEIARECQFEGGSKEDLNRCVTDETQARERRRPCGMAESGGPLLLRLSALRTQRASPVRPSPNDTTWRAAECPIAVDRKIGSDPATTRNDMSNPKPIFNSANRPAT
jgi:hypothetical protein